MLNKQDTNLEKEFDNYIGPAPLLTETDKEKFNEWLQHSSKSKWKKHLIPRLTTIILFIGFAVLLFSMIDSQDNNQIEQLTSEYPSDVKEKIAELPESVQENIVVPSKLPSESYNVQFTYMSEPMNDPNGRIVQTSFLYIGDNPSYHLILTTWYGNAITKNSKTYDKVTLDNGIVAKITGEKALKWKNDKGHLHELSIMEPPDASESQFSIDDIVNIANSIQ